LVQIEVEIIYKYGDLLEAAEKYICHCVNAQGKMASGVAKLIRAKYPKAYNTYMNVHNSNGLRVGQIIGADCGQHIVLNLVGQKNYGYDGRVYIDYLGLRKGISAINKNVKEPVAFPMIGAGLAGGDWKLISEIIQEESTDFQPVVYVLNDGVPWLE
jgi:O-acetyl-ADP-ribose deacetylase (regulator of RNase III)